MMNLPTHCCLSLSLLSVTVARHLKARWFFVHFVGNLMVTLTALPDVFRSFRDPLNSSLAEGDWTMWPCYFIGAIHLYHNHFFGFDLTPADTMHHFAFAFPFVFVSESIHKLSFGSFIVWCLSFRLARPLTLDQARTLLPLRSRVFPAALSTYYWSFKRQAMSAMRRSSARMRVSTSGCARPSSCSVPTPSTLPSCTTPTPTTCLFFTAAP